MNDIWNAVGQAKVKAGQKVSREQGNTPCGSHQRAETRLSSQNSAGLLGYESTWSPEESAYYNVQICLRLRTRCMLTSL